MNTIIAKTKVVIAARKFPNNGNIDMMADIGENIIHKAPPFIL